VVYQNDPEKTAAAHLRPGVFTLGDIGHVDDDGYVFITGRSADLIVSGGVNLYPAEIERVLLQVPGVADAAVVGAVDEEMGERAVAFIVPSVDDLSAAFVIDEAKKSLAGPKVPRDVRFIAELPRNPMGKIDRKQLKGRQR
jgi:acyl-CoA synthetase (AMP-forming)/AMP-acid ligase II